VAAFSAPTSEGVLYEVDLRLRPSGQQGPLATSLAAFERYQASEAWTWEHMALTRARVVAGPPALAARVEAAIRTVLCRPRDAAKVAADVVDMRRRIEADKGTTDIWNLKRVRGGLVDLEFVAQYLQLVSAHDDPSVLDTNTRTALEKLARAGRLTPADAATLQGAADLLHGLSGMLRLLLDRPVDLDTAPAGLRDCLMRTGDAPSFSALTADLTETLAAVRDVFDRLVAAPAKTVATATVAGPPTPDR
jgi:glutamate-ammonia-ligase adenylyltransferase